LDSSSVDWKAAWSARQRAGNLDSSSVDWRASKLDR
jgi:hypothetical protein